MLAGWLRWFADDRVQVEVGSIKPDERDPLAINVMKEVGLDIRGKRVDTLIKWLDDPWDWVILMRDPSKYKKPGLTNVKRMIYYEFPSPIKRKQSQEQALINYRNVRDDIHDWARTFCEKTVGLVRKTKGSQDSTLKV